MKIETKLGIQGVALAAWLGFADVLSASPVLVTERYGGGLGFSSEHSNFANIPRISTNDLATTATLTLLVGTPHGLSGPLSKLTDGLGQTGTDDPANSFFLSGANNPYGRILLDLGAIDRVTQVNTYSWHTDTRAHQAYELFASDGTSVGFDSTDPSSPGWTSLAFVRTHPLGLGGQHGSSIRDTTGVLGNFRYLMWSGIGTDTGVDTFYGEFDVIPEPTTAALVCLGGLGLVSRRRK